MISVEPICLCYTLRFHEAGEFGSPWSFACTLVVVEKEGLITAARGEYTMEIRRQLAEKLKEMGLESVRYERRKGGTTRAYQLTR